MAELIQLGIAGMKPAAVAAADAGPAKTAQAPEPEMVTMGTTGTAIFGRGYIRELGEYNSTFSGGPFSAYPTYEQMRRGDAQVSATLMAMKLPVRCASWAVQPPQDPTPAETECAEFIQENLFDGCDFDRILENLLLALDFGAACHENLWAYRNGRVVLDKAAPRLPLTFFNWAVDEREDLQALVQRGFHGGSYGEFVIPADKIALYTFRREGANFAGRSILREVYPHWYMKSALYKVDAIAAERNGMGVPVGTMAQGPTKEDRAKFEGFLRSLAAHESAYLMLPNGYQFDLKGVTGQIRDCWESIQHHNMQISMAGLAQFLIMGQQTKGSGNRSLGETMSDFFYLSDQVLADQLGDCLTDSTVAKLAAFNFGPKVRPPRLVPQQIMAMKFEAVVDALQKLSGTRVLTPDPDLEMWARQKMGAPKIEKAELVKLREKAISIANKTVDPEAQPGGEADPGGDEGDTSGADEDGRLKRKPGGSSGRKGTGGRGLGAGDKFAGSAAEWKAKGLRREPRGVEKCLALSAILGELDKGRDEVATALRGARRRVQSGAVQKLMARPVQQLHQVSLPLDEKLVKDVEGVLRRVYQFGRDQVGEERSRQVAGGTPEDAAKIRAAATPKKRRNPLGVYADATVSEFLNDLTARAVRVVLDYRRRQGDLTDGEVIEFVQEELNEQSDKWIDSVAAKGTNEAFADGRSDGFDDYREEIKGFYYSALLDLNTCEACAEADGSEGADEEDIPGVPNPDCDGGDKCRCVHVAVFADEGTVTK